MRKENAGLIFIPKAPRSVYASAVYFFHPLLVHVPLVKTVEYLLPYSTVSPRKIGQWVGFAII